MKFAGAPAQIRSTSQITGRGKAGRARRFVAHGQQAKRSRRRREEPTERKRRPANTRMERTPLHCFRAGR